MTHKEIGHNFLARLGKKDFDLVELKLQIG